MNPPSVVNLKAEPFDVYIGRPSKWGNPFIIGRDGTRDEVIAAYRRDLWQKINSGALTSDDFEELSGKTLGCYCRPQACHGDVLVEVWGRLVERCR